MLCNLPKDVISVIYSFLSPSASFSLSLTCTYLNRKVPVNSTVYKDAISTGNVELATLVSVSSRRINCDDIFHEVCDMGYYKMVNYLIVSHYITPTRKQINKAIITNNSQLFDVLVRRSTRITFTEYDMKKVILMENHKMLLTLRKKGCLCTEGIINILNNIENRDVRQKMLSAVNLPIGFL